MEETCNELHIACLNNNLTLIAELIKTKTDKCSKESHVKETALCIAASEGSYDIVKYLLSVKANVCLPSANGLLPLHIAQVNCDLPLVELLCTFKTANLPLAQSVGITSEQNFPICSTAVHIAVKLGHVGILTHICKFNPNFFQKDADEKTALDIAMDMYEAEQCNKSVLEVILQNTAVFHEATAKGYVTIVRRLLQCGADVNSLNKAQGSALYVAVEANKPDVLKELIRHGCDLDTRITLSSYVRRYQQGLTALHLACMRLQVDTVETLLQAGASPNTQDAFRDTPLTTVCKMYWRISPRSPDRKNKVKVIAEHLLNHNAIVNMSLSSSTLLEIAMGCDPRTAVNDLSLTLLSAGAHIQPLSHTLEACDMQTVRDHFLSLPHNTQVFLAKCGVNLKHHVSPVSEVTYTKDILSRPFTLLDTCLITIRKLIQLNCFNIWSGMQFLDLPPGFDKALLRLNWNSLQSFEK